MESLIWKSARPTNYLRLINATKLWWQARPWLNESDRLVANQAQAVNSTRLATPASKLQTPIVLKGMPQLVDGAWTVPEKAKDTGFHGWLSSDGSNGPKGQKGFKAEKGRYVLYVSHGCPFAHRTSMIRVLKGLEDLIPLYVVYPTVPFDSGMTFRTDMEGTTGDPVNNFKLLSEVYTKSDPKYTGKVAVPVLFDTKDQVVVSNDSSDIIKMLNSAFDGLGAKDVDLYPEGQREAIDKAEGVVMRIMGNSFKAGGAPDQASFNSAQDGFYSALAELDALLGKQKYLVGDSLTLADIKLFAPLCRLDLGLLQKNKLIYKRLADFPNAAAYEKRLRSILKETVNPEHIAALQYCDRSPNKNDIIPKPPVVEL